VERGVNFLYPWGWPDPSVLTDQSGQPDQLEVSDPNGDVRIDVAKRDGSIDKVAQDVVDLENGLTDAQVDAPVPFGSDPTFAQWITYSYTAGDGTPRSGAVIVRRVDSNDATYTFDVDSPEAKLNYAQAIMEKMVNSLTFFTPFTPPDTSSSTPQP